MNPQYLV